jgi:hypothetical protein
MTNVRMHGRGTATAVAMAAAGAALLIGPVAAGARPAPAKLLAQVDLKDAARCDFIAGGDCLFPFPSDRFTVADRRTPTGRRIHFTRAALPANAKGVHIDPTELNRNDGFSPGQEIVLQVPGLQAGAAFRRTGAVPLTNMADAFRRRQPIVLIDAATRKRQLIWAELDAHATKPADRALLIHPGTNLQAGHRYIVALRDIRTAKGRTIPAPAGFRLYRDGLTTRVRAVESRRAHFASIFRTLRRAGIARRSLYLAWDFTVASTKSTTSRLLAIRDDAFKQLGDANLADEQVAGHAPAFQVATVTDFTAAENPRIARQVAGTFDVPCYLAKQGCPSGSAFHFAGTGPDALPSQIPGNVYHAQFICIVPRASGVAGGPIAAARPVIYGHGLLGQASEVTAAPQQAMAQEHDMVYCATPEIGFAGEDIGTAIAVLGDLSRFPAVADRTQQGLLDELYLGRLLIHPQGLAADPAFQAGGQPVIDTRRLFYDGNSQGGILGGALTAVAPDFDRAVLGVPAMNYSVLLPRSTDFAKFAAIFEPAYPKAIQRQLALSVAQMLWDRADPDGYAAHMTSDPLPNTPRHTVLMQLALGDFQVTNVMAEVEARTIGARVRTPIADPGRIADRTPFYGIPRIGRFPYDGSAITLWDAGPIRAGGTLGTTPAPDTNTAPVPGPKANGNDPHGLPRATPAARQQKSDFLRIGGKVTDPCGASPCHSAPTAGG